MSSIADKTHMDPAMTRAELEALGWTDAKLDELYITYVGAISSIDQIAGRPDTQAIQRLRRERYAAVCAKIYA